MRSVAKKTMGSMLALLMFGAVLAEYTNADEKKSAAASTFPNKAITLIVPYTAGGSSDVGARLIAKSLEKELKQPVVVENAPGASGMVGLQKLVMARPDGYTLSLFTLGHVTGYLNPKTKKDINRDSLTLLSNHVWDVTAWGVRPESPFKNMKEVMAYIKKNPNKQLTIGTSGLYTQHHIAQLMLENLGYKLRPVHTNGLAESLTLAMGGHIDIVSMGAGDIRNQAKEGTIRSLVVLDSKRSKFLPDVPTFKESTGIDLIAFAVRGYVGPANMDPGVVKRLEDALKKVMEDPNHIAEMEKMGLDVKYMDSKTYKIFIKNTEKDFKKTLGW